MLLHQQTVQPFRGASTFIQQSGYELCFIIIKMDQTKARSLGIKYLQATSVDS